MFKGKSLIHLLTLLYDFYIIIIDKVNIIHTNYETGINFL